MWTCPNFAPRAFPFADLAMGPFTVINHSCWHNCMLSAPNESVNLGVVLGTPTQDGKRTRRTGEICRKGEDSRIQENVEKGQ